LSAPQRRRWDALWSHPSASTWEPTEAGAMVAELIRLETGEALGKLNAREREQIARLRRSLLLTIPARRAAGVALPTDPHAVNAVRPPTSTADSFADQQARHIERTNALATALDRDPAAAWDHVSDVELHRLARRAAVDDGATAAPVHFAAAAERARRQAARVGP
jgi:hypothetical protein